MLLLKMTEIVHYYLSNFDESVVNLFFSKFWIKSLQKRQILNSFGVIGVKIGSHPKIRFFTTPKNWSCNNGKALWASMLSSVNIWIWIKMGCIPINGLFGFGPISIFFLWLDSLWKSLLSLNGYIWYLF